MVRANEDGSSGTSSYTISYKFHVSFHTKRLSLSKVSVNYFIFLYNKSSVLWFVARKEAEDIKHSHCLSISVIASIPVAKWTKAKGRRSRQEPVELAEIKVFSKVGTSAAMWRNPRRCITAACEFYGDAPLPRIRKNILYLIYCLF